MDSKIQQFLSSPAFAVAGASSDRNKFGNKVLRCYMQHHKEVYPVNPNEKMVEGLPCVSQVLDLPDHVKSLSIITPPKITKKIVEQAIKKGIQHIWMQPGAESDVAIHQCEQNNIDVIHSGPCILVVLGFE
jgi:predicted CoA-binding protein